MVVREMRIVVGEISRKGAVFNRVAFEGEICCCVCCMQSVWILFTEYCIVDALHTCTASGEQFHSGYILLSLLLFCYTDGVAKE